MRLLILFWLLFSVSLSAQQWEDVGGPYGGTFVSIIAHGDSIVAAPYYRPFLLIGGAHGEQWRNIAMPSASAEAFSLLSPGGGRLLAGSFGRIYRTDDNGARWQESYLTDLQGAIVTGLTGRGDTLYACGGGILLRSTNRGSNWLKVPDAPGTDAVLARPGLLLVGGPAGLSRTVDGGATWETLPAVPDSVTALFEADGIVFASLSPSETDSLGQTFYRSTDAGDTWGATDLRGTAIRTMSVHGGMFYAGEAAPAGTEYFFQSSDSGRTWIPVPPPSPPFPHDIRALHSASDGLLCSLGGIGIWKLGDNAESWRNVSYGHFPVGVAKLAFDDSRIYAYSMKENFIAVRAHGSPTWEPLLSATAHLNERPGDMFLHAGALYLGISGAVLRSLDMGTTWSSSPVPHRGASVQSISAAGSRLIAGVAYHPAVYSDDGGATWAAGKGAAPEWWFGFAHRGNEVYAATSGGVLRSTDRGENWSFILGGISFAVAMQDDSFLLVASQAGVKRYRLDTMEGTTLWSGPAYVLHVLPSKQGLFAATGDSGVVYFPNGLSPVAINAGLPQVGFAPPTVCRIAFDSHDGRLYFGNCGLPGLWSLKLSSIVGVEHPPSLPLRPEITGIHPHPLSTEGMVRLSLPTEAPVRLRLVDVLGRTRSILHEGPLPAGANSIAVRPHSLAPGIYHILLETGNSVVVRTVVIM